MRKATGGYRTYSIPGKAAALVPEFSVEDLPLGRTLMLLHYINYIIYIYTIYIYISFIISYYT